MTNMVEHLKYPKLLPFARESLDFYCKFLSKVSPHYYQFSGIEFSLFSHDECCDWLVELKPQTLSWNFNKELPGLNLSYETYKRLSNFFMDNNSEISKEVRNIWLEYDWFSSYNKKTDKLTPSIFFGSKTDNYYGAYKLLNHVFPKLPDISWILNQARTLNMQLTQAGYMYGRKIPSLRVVFTTYSFPDIEKFISAIGLPILHNSMFKTFLLDSNPSLLAIGLDIADSGIVSNAYGIEIYKEWMNNSAWSSLLDTLTKAYGKCSKVASLTDLFISNKLFPAIYKQPFKNIQDTHQILVCESFTGPHHLKASFHPNLEIPKFKAYVGFLFPHLLVSNGTVTLSETHDFEE